MSFNGFISYSHAADGRLAPAVQRGLHRLAKPWHRRRALWIFRDQTGLSVTPGLWTSIQKALDNSEYFVLMASPEAARSPWVNREIEHWVANKPLERILPVVTDGEWRWDPAARDFDPESNSVPPALRGVFAEEPLYLDLRWARDDQHLSLRHSRFRDAIAQLAAPMHGVSKDDLEGEDVRQHRRGRRLRLSAAASLVVLTLLATATGLSAMQNAARANASAVEARRQQQEATAQRGHAARFADEAQRQEELVHEKEARVRSAAAEAVRQEQAAKAQKALADKASGEVKVQLDKAGKAADQARRQQALAERQAKLADESATAMHAQEKRAKEMEQLAREQEKAAGEAGAEAAKQRAIAEEQQKLAAQAREMAAAQEAIAREQEKKAKEAAAEAERQQRVAISRRLVNEGKAIVSDDSRTAFKLGIAAQRINPSPEIKREVTGLVTSTRRITGLDDVFETKYGPDGLLVTAATGPAITLWNVGVPAKPIRVATIETGGSFPRLALTRDGKTLAVVWDEGGGLWNVSDPARPVHTANLPGDRHYAAVEFSPNGRVLATGDRSMPGPDGLAAYATLWDVSDHERPAELSRLRGNGDGWHPAVDVSFSRDGRTLAASYLSAVVWDVSDPRDPVKRSQIDPLSPSFGLAFNPAEPVLAIGDQSGTITVYDMNDPAAPRAWYTIRSGSQSNLSLAYSLDGRYLAAGFVNGTTMVWDTTAGDHHELATMVGRVSVTSVDFSRDNHTLATVESAETAVLWSLDDFAAPERRVDQVAHDRGLLLNAFSPDGRTLVTAGGDGRAVFWNVPAGPGGYPAPTADIALQNGEPADLVTISSDVRTMVSGNQDSRRVILRDTTNPAASAPFASMTLQFRPEVLLLSADGRRLAMAGDNQLQLWDLSNHAVVRRLAVVALDIGRTPRLALSPDGGRLAVTSGKNVHLYDLSNPATPVKVATLSGHADDTMAVAFAPDGRTLATGGEDRTVILFDVSDPTDPQRLATLNGHVEGVSKLLFSPDGTTLAVGEFSRWVTLWDVAVLNRPVRLSRVASAHLWGPGAIAFNPGGTTLALGRDANSLGYLGLWDLTELSRLRTDPATFGCTLAGRGLTSAEWARLIPEIQYQPTCTG
ncbi:TIR domain-containing protein [Actinoplanes sp. NPDC049265]|uniref:TIR domain-containing protein n=1 Tax=Actinoplanes sp. NPDC049265 TaxID=3363902 RepID=UPI003714449F